jgi:hypothetical protein
MPEFENSQLLACLDETRAVMEKLLPSLSPGQQIYPGWTMKDLLAHMTGWDVATLDSLQAHLTGNPPAVTGIGSLDEYNASTVSSRQHLSFDQVLSEWRQIRQQLRLLILEMPAEKFTEPVLVPWGGKSTVTELIEIFRSHEEEHINDVQEWAKDMTHPLCRTGG